MFKVNNEDTRLMPLTYRSGVFIVRTYFKLCSSVPIVNFEHVIASWDLPGKQTVTIHTYCPTSEELKVIGQLNLVSL